LKNKLIILLLVIIAGVIGFNLCGENDSGLTFQYFAADPEEHYYNGNIAVSVKKIQGHNKKGEVLFRGYVMMVNDPGAVKVALPEGGPGSLQTTSAMAKKAGAVAAVNGGGFFIHSVPGKPLNYPLYYTVKGGKLVSQVDRYNSEILVGFTKRGNLVGGTFANAYAIKKAGIVEGVSFKPQLIKDGKRLHGPGGDAHPRTAIGQKKDGSLLFVVIDGRRPGWSLGVTIYQLQEVMMNLGAYNAFNLDGGGSSTMVFQNKVLNNPSDAFGERSVATCWVVVDKSKKELTVKPK